MNGGDLRRRFLRLPDDPGPLGYVWFGLGFRLPSRHREWVRHDLTDAGWRGRMLRRHAVVFAPLCALLGLLPGSWILRAAVTAMVFGCSLATVALYGDEIRASRLRQHNCRVPDGPRPGPDPPDPR